MNVSPVPGQPTPHAVEPIVETRRGWWGGSIKKRRSNPEVVLMANNVLNKEFFKALWEQIGNIVNVAPVWWITGSKPLTASISSSRLLYSPRSKAILWPHENQQHTPPSRQHPRPSMRRMFIIGLTALFIGHSRWHWAFCQAKLRQWY